MNLLIDTKGRKMLVAATSKTGALIEALADAIIIDEEYKDGRYVYKPAGTEEAPETIGVSFVSEGLLSKPTPMIDDLTANLKRSDARWMDEYRKRAALETELTELKAKLEGLIPSQDEEK